MHGSSKVHLLYLRTKFHYINFGLFVYCVWRFMMLSYWSNSFGKHIFYMAKSSNHLSIVILTLSRAFHVFSEAQRVIDFVETSSLTEMGNLMNDSHTSCDELYDCSCNELNRLVTVCRFVNLCFRLRMHFISLIINIYLVRKYFYC